ncbi:anaerobic ribonucleoside-triphosphate reductase activating protein [Thermospira aquatica]|uniref:Anaerobic ribonucleoside-triphosphate reductase activating protein n=1 Tax=Thermospira aquatica TaxID=2828656 RepID=A0AAX3BAG4_9SPIR|nr:anaerobic ribonucleoside-triphosphate reductase activating protein [Thermospira aquatica]URA09176.1 anaerobic ribonucleoside-triphosphate reductase activating protein [Thermospira aquatica]
MFYGLQKTTLVDFPGRIAATLFTGGCNFRCPWCHNKDLVYPERLGLLSPLPEDDIKAFLLQRKDQLDGICVTGGEPTLWGDRLIEFLLWAKSLGYETKIDTNGSHPEWIERALKEKAVDFFAMDIKQTWESYREAIGLPSCDISLLKKSIKLIQASGKPHQFRTTLIPGISPKSMEKLTQELGISLVFQEYRDPTIYEKAINREENALRA